jgi:choline dehydrogenase
MVEAAWDYIVCGAGTAGCLLANRLSAEPRKRVLLVEAGGHDDYVWVHIPVGYLYCIGNPRTDWLYQTEPDPGLNGRRLRYPRGKLLGGSSSINGMIYMRGQRRDYDGWGAGDGHGFNPGWSWSECLPYFLKHEDHHGGANEHHSAPGFDAKGARAGGEWRVEKQRLRWDILDAFAEAAQQAGIKSCPDFNCGDNEGVGYFEVNQRRGLRWNASKAFLRPVIHRPNLQVWTGAHIHRLLLERAAGRPLRAIGIEAVAAGTRERVEARVRSGGEVVLAAGSIGSPAILQLSGVGPPDLLQRHGIEVRQPLPGVGAHLQDHLQIRAVFGVEGVTTLNTRARTPWGKALIALEYAARRTGPMSMAPSQLGAFAKSDADRAHPNLEYHVQPLSLDAFGEPLHRFNAFTASVCNLNPTSRGTVAIRSADPLEAPARRRAGPAPHAPHRRATCAREVPAARGQARRRASDRRRARAARRRHRHHDLPSRRHGEDGTCRRSRGRGRRAPARAWRGRLARRRRERDAHHHERQHECADPNDRGARRGMDPRRRVTAKLRTRGAGAPGACARTGCLR